ncbi:MAG TPA: peptidylprolyl isomerase [Bacteroidales bacterium]|nr:peptidylprolyl isomerase [Bacteroidales bacterium]
MKNKTRLLFSFLLAAILLAGMVSCFKDNNEEKEMKIIANFLKDQGIDTEPTESGLYYIEMTEGTGIQPVTGDTVEIYYVGYFLDGRIFDSNLNSDPFRFALGSGNTIQGIDEGVSYMKESGKALLVIPSSLGYGSTGSYVVPGYTPLAFDVVLDKVIIGPYH